MALDMTNSNAPTFNLPSFMRPALYVTALAFLVVSIVSITHYADTRSALPIVTLNLPLLAFGTICAFPSYADTLGSRIISRVGGMIIRIIVFILICDFLTIGVGTAHNLEMAMPGFAAVFLLTMYMFFAFVLPGYWVFKWKYQRP